MGQREIVKKFPKIGKTMIFLYNHIIGRNHFKIRKGNKINCNSSRLKNCNIQVKGKNNRIQIGPYASLVNCNIHIDGNNNLITIQENCYCKELCIAMEENDNTLKIGKNTTIHGKTNLDVIESCKIEIEEDCMLSSDISIRTGDSHAIVDERGNRINPSKDVTIGKHVWIGMKVIILKGVEIKENTIVGAGSLVTKTFQEGNIILAGNPAKIIKQNVNWSRER